MASIEGLFIVCAMVFFYRLARMDNRSAIIWCLASLAASVLAMYVLGIHVLVAQAALFCVMWYLNYIKPHRKIDV